MKTAYLLVFVLIFISCNKDQNTTLSGKWKLTVYHNLTSGSYQSEPSEISQSIIIDFSDDGYTGTMSGHTVTNTVSGDYELLKTNKMKTLSFGGTKIGEPEWGNKFWDAIYSASSYRREGNIMYIYFNSDTEMMEFDSQ